MAASGFPQRKASGAGGMTAPGAGQEQLDGPPPSPTMAQVPGGGQMTPGMPMGGQQQMPTFSQMAQPLTAGTPGRAVSPEIATGMLQAAQTIYGMLDSFASMVPDLANEYALQKDLLQRTMAKLFESSGQNGAAGATGVNFPGGGFSTGAM